jgi:hypothetical protein
MFFARRLLFFLGMVFLVFPVFFTQKVFAVAGPRSALPYSCANPPNYWAGALGDNNTGVPLGCNTTNTGWIPDHSDPYITNGTDFCRFFANSYELSVDNTSCTDGCANPLFMGDTSYDNSLGFCIRSPVGYIACENSVDVSSCGGDCGSSSLEGFCCNYPGETPWPGAGGSSCTPDCGYNAQRQQCNSSGTAWVDIPNSNVCLAVTSCGITKPEPDCSVAKWLVKGSVFYDIGNDDGIYNGSDIMYPSGANISVADPAGPSVSVSTGTSGVTLGLYQTDRIWTDEHNVTLTFNTSLPTGCSLRSSNPSPYTINDINSDKTVNFPIVGKVMLQGHNVDINGNDLTASAGFTPNISISGPTNATNTNLGYWNFQNVNSGTYTVTAAVPAGYTVEYSYPGVDQSPDPQTRSYTSGNVVTGVKLHCGQSADIWFRYTSSNVTIQGHFVDGYINASDSFMSRTLDGTDRTITITGGGLSGPVEPDYNATAAPDSLWRKYLVKSNNPFTVTVSPPMQGYEIQVAPCKNSSSCGSPRSYTVDNSTSFTLPSTNNYADIYFKYVPKVMIQGHFVDGGNNFVEARGRTITITGGALTQSVEPRYDIPDSEIPNSHYLWRKGSLTPSSTNKFTLVASAQLGADISYILCNAAKNNNADCSSPGNLSNITWIPIPTGSVTLPYYLDTANDWTDIYFKYIPKVCRVTTTPSIYDFTLGETVTGPVMATVTNLPVGGRILDMRFGSYNGAVASVPPPVPPDIEYTDRDSPHTALATAKAVGETAIWATADVDENNDGVIDSICETTGDTDTNIVVSGPITIIPSPTLNPGPFTISGQMFIDTGKDGKKNNADSTKDLLYTGSVTISIVRNSTGISYAATNTGGTYTTGNALPGGAYTVTFSGLPADMGFTYPPLNLGTYSLGVVVGPGCSTPGTSEASCPGGNIIDLNAGVVNTTTGANPWFQSIGSDIKWDKPQFGINSGTAYALPYGKYASIAGSGGMPGIIFTGPDSFPQTSQASQTVDNQFNWQVQGDIFTATHNLIPTSYGFLLGTAQNSGIPITDIGTVTSSMVKGIYKVAGDLTISSPITFGSGNFIILVDGDLNINSNITVPVGSTVIFSASRSIVIGATVTQIAGLYSADSNFIVSGISSCPGTIDAQLNVSGSAIANAGRQGGTFRNGRDLCAGNSTTPSVTFTERPDFAVNYPALVRLTTRVWTDLAP